MLSPACARVVMVMNCAACPEAAARAATPPSSAAMRCSKTPTVGYREMSSVSQILPSFLPSLNFQSSDFYSLSIWMGTTYVPDTAVDVAELFEAEQPRAMRRVIEGE